MEILINAKEIQSRKNCIRFLCNVFILYKIIVILGFLFYYGTSVFFNFNLHILFMRIQPDVFLL